MKRSIRSARCWQHAPFYQIDDRFFADANHDGVEELAGNSKPRI
jgi:hypothetical protein